MSRISRQNMIDPAKGAPAVFVTLVITLLAALGKAPATHAEEGVEAANRETVARAFAAWAKGSGSVFDILSDDMVWTVTGVGGVADTYEGKQRFVTELVEPFAARLERPLKPAVRGLWADGDVVLVHFDGQALGKDGKPYNNTYLWIFRMLDGEAVEVTAFLDNTAYTDFLKRIPIEGSGRAD